MTRLAFAVSASGATDLKFAVQRVDSSSVQKLDIPVDLFAVRPADGAAEAYVRIYDLQSSTISGNTVVTAWSRPESVIRSYGLDQLHVKTIRLLAETFGPAASLTPEIDVDPDGNTPMLVFRFKIRRDQRGLRAGFVDRYVRETALPPGAPVPVLAWTTEIAAVPA